MLIIGVIYLKSTLDHATAIIYDEFKENETNDLSIASRSKKRGDRAHFFQKIPFNLKLFMSLMLNLLNLMKRKSISPILIFDYK